jgi:hypothetical protein
VEDKPEDDEGEAEEETTPAEEDDDERPFAAVLDAATPVPGVMPLHMTLYDNCAGLV